MAGRWHQLVSLSYKALPVPSPIRSSFDTQLSNQDLGFSALMNDSSGRLQAFSSINSGCSFREWMDGQNPKGRAHLHLAAGCCCPKKETNKQTEFQCNALLMWFRKMRVKVIMLMVLTRLERWSIFDSDAMPMYLLY